MKLSIILCALGLGGFALAGPAAYAICQTACSAALVAGPAAPAIYAACQAALMSTLFTSESVEAKVGQANIARDRNGWVCSGTWEAVRQ
ncbi:hypothetical protein MY11210_002197 [Beauveria gryllotalpidicola]